MRLPIALVLLVLWSGVAPADRVTPSDRVKESVTARRGPTASAAAVGTLAKGESAEVLGTTKYWNKVKLPDGTVAYVSRAWTTVVPEASAVAAGKLVVTFVDVGQGDAILLQVGAVDLLIDTGPRGSWKRGLAVALQSIDGPIETMFLTHPHDDHYGGGVDVLANHEVAAVYTNSETRGPPRDKKRMTTWDAFEAAVANAKLTLQGLKVGQVLTPAPGLVLTVLATGSSSGGEFPDTDDGGDINNDSLVLMAEYGGKRILFTGDVQGEADRLLVQRNCPNGDASKCPQLHADVLKVPHHGSAEFDKDFYAAVAPTWAVISAEYNSTKHHLPRSEPIDALRALGAKVLSTSADGEENVVLTITDAGAVTWSTPTAAVFAWKKSGAGYKGVTYPQNQ